MHRYDRVEEQEYEGGGGGGGGEDEYGGKKTCSGGEGREFRGQPARSLVSNGVCMTNREECELTPTETVNGAKGCSDSEICCSRTPCSVKDVGDGFCAMNTRCDEMGDD
mgnify:FL=1